MARLPARERSRGDASDIDGQADRSNGAFGKSDIEGKAAMVAASELGKERVSNEREQMSQCFRSLEATPTPFRRSKVAL
jgi:hypothetical protein